MQCRGREGILYLWVHVGAYLDMDECVSRETWVKRSKPISTRSRQFRMALLQRTLEKCSRP